MKMLQWWWVVSCTGRGGGGGGGGGGGPRRSCLKCWSRLVALMIGCSAALRGTRVRQHGKYSGNECGLGARNIDSSFQFELVSVRVHLFNDLLQV